MESRGILLKRREDLLVEIMMDIAAHEEELGKTMSLKHKAHLICELVNSTERRWCPYKDNPLRFILFSLPWEEMEVRDGS
jgi:hypothetical protein